VSSAILHRKRHSSSASPTSLSTILWLKSPSMDFADNFHYPRFNADRSTGTLVGVAHPGGFTLVRFICVLIGSMRCGVLLKFRTGARVVLIFVMNQIFAIRQSKQSEGGRDSKGIPGISVAGTSVS